MKEQAGALGFDLCGVAPVDDFPELAFLREWLDRGYAGEMAWMARTADRRRDVRAVMPQAQSVIVTGTLYNTDRPYSIAWTTLTRISAQETEEYAPPARRASHRRWLTQPPAGQ